jgi:hypothetical protein
MDGSPVASVLDPVVLLVAGLEELQRWIAGHVLIQTVLCIRMGSDRHHFAGSLTGIGRSGFNHQYIILYNYANLYLN